MNWRAFTIAAGLFLLPGSALACGAYPVGVNASDVVIGLVADGSNRIGYTSQSNAGSSRAGMVVYNRTNNTLHVCDGVAWRTLVSPGGTTAAGSAGQVQFNSAGVLGADAALNWDNTNKRMGFGTAVPIDQLSNNPTDTIDSNSLGTGTTAFNWNQNAAGYVASIYNANTTTNGAGVLVKGSGVTTNPLFSVDTGPAQATAGTSIFKVLGNGRVGIGSATPASSLEVRGNLALGSGAASSIRTSNSTAYLTIATSSATDKRAAIQFQQNANPTFEVGVDTNLDNANNFFIYDGQAAVRRLVIDPNGNLGIGTATPNQGRVEVKGGSVCVDTNSDDNATQCIASESDARLKKNVKPLTGALDTLMKLRGVTFDWRADDADVLKHYSLIGRFAQHPHSVGVIAQEVEAVFPYAIEAETVGDAEVQYKQVDYTKFMPLLIEAVKELKAENDALRDKYRAEIEELRQEIKALKASR